MNVEINLGEEKIVIEDVPDTNWEALKPFWPSIVKAIIEVFLKGNFNPYHVTKERKNGFIASNWYWNQSVENFKNYPLKEAKRFIFMLRENDDFVETIKEFNKFKNVDWTLKKNFKQLGQFLYKNCYNLEELLALLKDKYHKIKY